MIKKKHRRHGISAGYLAQERRHLCDYVRPDQADQIMAERLKQHFYDTRFAEDCIPKKHAKN